jgi:hypothetical protein
LIDFLSMETWWESESVMDKRAIDKQEAHEYWVKENYETLMRLTYEANPNTTRTPAHIIIDFLVNKCGWNNISIAKAIGCTPELIYRIRADRVSGNSILDPLKELLCEEFYDY